MLLTGSEGLPEPPGDTFEAAADSYTDSETATDEVLAALEAARADADER